MKILSLNKTALLSIALLAAAVGASKHVSAQTSFQSKDMDMRLKGTSNLHPWEMKAVKGTSKAVLVVDAEGKVTSISSLSFSFPAKNLKSGKTAMDKNTYKALKTDKNPNITFILTSSTITSTGANTYDLTGVGNMTIAGTLKQTSLIATGRYNSDGSFTITGVKKMKMTDYKVNPPTALLGRIKTGDDITLSYNIQFNR
jgi:hypothetical protein